MRESGLVLGSITVREGERDTERYTGANVLERERGKERESGRKKGREQLVLSRMLSGGLCVSCKGAEGISLGLQSLQH